MQKLLLGLIVMLAFSAGRPARKPRRMLRLDRWNMPNRNAI